MMLIIGRFRPRKTAYVPIDAKATDMTPWKYAKHAGAALLLIVFAIYACFADFSHIRKKIVEIPRAPGYEVSPEAAAFCCVPGSPGMPFCRRCEAPAKGLG